MDKKDPKKTVLEMGARLDHSEARRLLVTAGISPSTADKLLYGTYEHKVGPLAAAAIQRAYRAFKRAAA